MSGMKPTPSSSSPVDVESAGYFASSLHDTTQLQNRWWRRIPKRYILALMMFIANFILNWMRNNLLVLVLDILSDNDKLDKYTKVSEWSFHAITIIDIADFVGCAVGQIPGSLLVIRFSAHKLIAASLAVYSIMHVTVPLMLNHHVAAIMIIEFLQGIVTGPFNAACIGMWRSWAPPKEKTSLVSITFSGAFLGIATSSYLCKYLIVTHGDFIGFFTSGTCGIAWCILWFIFIYETPSSHPSILQSELAYLEQSISVDSKANVTVKSLPIKAILKSLPVFAMLLAYASHKFTFYMIQLSCVMDIVLYGSEADYLLYHVFVPIQLFWVAMVLSGFFYDFVIGRNLGDTTLVRKIFCSGGLVCSGIALACILVPSSSLSITTLTLAAVFLGFSASGIITNVLDISSRYSCFLIAYADTIADGALIINLFTISSESISDQMPFVWKVVIALTCGLSISASVIFAIWSSAEEQPWSTGQTPVPQAVLGSSYYPGDDTADEGELVTERL